MVGDALVLLWEKWEIKFKIPLLQYFWESKKPGSTKRKILNATLI